MLLALMLFVATVSSSVFPVFLAGKCMLTLCLVIRDLIHPPPKKKKFRTISEIKLKNSFMIVFLKNCDLRIQKTIFSNRRKECNF